MNRTRIFYTDTMGTRWEIDDIVKASKSEHFTALRVVDGVPVLIPVQSVEVEK